MTVRLILASVIVGFVLLVACSGPRDQPLAGAVTPTATAAERAAAPSAPTATTATTGTAAATPAIAATVATPVVVTPAATPTPSLVATPTAAAEPTLPPEPSAGQTAEVPILMYHYVRPDPGPHDPVGQDLSVTPEDFAAEMQYLADTGYTPITLGELADVRAKKATLPGKPVVLSFDDGYRDFYTNAWPVLRQHRFKATIFVITGVVDQPQYMTWAMLDELDRSGLIEVGSHTVNHRELPALSADQATAELVGSKQALTEKLGHPIRSFCYPSGRFSDQVVALVKRAGYSIATTTQGGFAEASDEPLLLPRVRVHGTHGLPSLEANLP